MSNEFFNCGSSLFFMIALEMNHTYFWRLIIYDIQMDVHDVIGNDQEMICILCATLLLILHVI